MEVENKVLATVTAECNFNGYYASTAASVFTGSLHAEINIEFKCAKEIYQATRDLTKPGTRFTYVIKYLDAIYAKYGLVDNRVIGYTHGAGLQIEEYPITTIVPAHRTVKVKQG
ncbi:MAG: M24 family metallopeptidase [Desulfurococcaceae archaeon]